MSRSRRPLDGSEELSYSVTGKARFKTCLRLQELQRLGWTEGRNLRIDIRWAGGDALETRRHAAEVVALAPDVIVATGTAAMRPLLLATRTVPIVHEGLPQPDPIYAGHSLRPAGVSAETRFV